MMKIEKYIDILRYIYISTSQDILRSGNKWSEQCIILFNVYKQIHGIYLHIHTHKFNSEYFWRTFKWGEGVRGEGCLTFALYSSVLSENVFNINIITMLHFKFQSQNPDL